MASNIYYSLKELKYLLSEGDYISLKESGTFKEVIARMGGGVRVKDNDKFIFHNWDTTYEFSWIKKENIDKSLEKAKDFHLVIDFTKEPLKEEEIQKQLIIIFKIRKEYYLELGNLSGIYYFRELIKDGIIPYDRASLTIKNLRSGVNLTTRWRDSNTILLNEDNLIFPISPLVKKFLLE